MSSLLGVLPFGERVIVPGLGMHELEPGDLEVWAERAHGTCVHSAVSTGRRMLAGHVDRVRVDKGKAYIFGDLDPSLPGGPEARWAVVQSGGVYDRLDARMFARPDPLRELSTQERARLVQHWGAFPEGSAGVFITSLSVSAIGVAPGAAWLGA